MDQSVKTLASDGADGRGWIGRIIIAVILGEAIWSLIVSVMNNVVVPWLGDVMGQSGGLPTSFTQRPYNYPDLFVSIFEFCIACLVAAILNYFFQQPRAARVRSAKNSVSAVPATPMQVIPQSVATTPPTPAPISQAAPAQSALLQPGFPRPIETKPPSETKPNVPQPLVSQPSVARENQPHASSPVELPAPVMKPQPVIPSTPAAAAPTSPTPPLAPAPVARPVIAATPPALAPANAEAAKPLPPKPKAEPAKPKKPRQVYYNIVGEPMPSDED
jgi:large-conductance mechanosensitive channel